MTLTNSDVKWLTDLRRHLHQHPEISGQEGQTAQTIDKTLGSLAPDKIILGLGGHGLAACFNGDAPGPTIMFRCELDALPIQQISNSPYRSNTDGVAHLCGHDGHMVILMGLAQLLARQRPARGRVVLLFQPAEETGQGAAAVLADPKFSALSPDYAFALHNLPGITRGTVALKSGPVCCASCGLEVSLKGTPAHASQPETGTSPMPALSELMPELAALSRGDTHDAAFSLVTITHAALGAPAFGIAPGQATLYATLRTLTDDRMAALCDAALALVDRRAHDHGLDHQHQFHDIFHHCENDVEATGIITTALDRLGIAYSDTSLPWRPSEDFGRFGSDAKSAILFLGAGVDQAPLHNLHYDFPDDLIAIGARVFNQIARDLLG